MTSTVGQIQIWRQRRWGSQSYACAPLLGRFRFLRSEPRALARANSPGPLSFEDRQTGDSSAGNALIALLLLFALLGSGCTGGATLHIIPLNQKKISMTAPLIVRIDPDQCYYWVNDNGHLCIAMRNYRWSLLGSKFAKESVLSFVVEEPPAGSTRNFRVTRRTVRHRFDAGLTHLRSASLGGIVAVWDYGQRVLRGRFRLTVRQQSYSALAGWGSNRTVLLVGEFSAVHNPKAGRRILDRTERDGMERQVASQAPVRVIGPPRR